METPTKLSFSPSNILARLEELKRWQTEQEERLKKRQAQQREVLSSEQRRMCEAFELTSNSSFTSSVSETSCDCDNKTAETDQSSHIPESSIDEVRADSKNDSSTFQECINLTEKNEANVSVGQLNFDEIPINSIKQSILIEKSVMSASAEISADRPKFQYLKRGAGLSRYRMSKDDIFKNRNSNQAKPFPKSIQPKKTIKKPEIKKKIEPVWKSVSCSVKSPTSNWKSPEKLERPYAQPYPVITKDSYEKLLEELKIKRDREELKIFELLEERAQNSSFCSTSSALKNLPDNSTPKLERLLKAQLGIMGQNEQTPPISPVKIQRKLYDENEEDKSLHVRFENGIDDSQNSQESSRSNSPENYQDQIEWSDTSEENDEDKTETNFQNNFLNNEMENNQVAIDKEIEQLRSVNETSDSVADDDAVFKSDLLKKRLLELESEIQTFRKENSNLIKRRQEYDHLKRVLLKEKTEKEKHLADEKIRIDKYIEDEKRKIAREKMVFEKYVKDTKNQPNRKEREEIVALKDEVRTLKEELKVKESKHGATQARLRTQIRTLEKELSNAKKEIEKLQKENRRLSNIQKRQAGISNTKVLHEINKNISKILPKAMAQTQLKNLEKSDKQISQKTQKKTDKEVSSSSESEDESSSENTQINQSSDEESVGEEPKRSEVHKTLFKTMYPNSKHSYFPENSKQKENACFEVNDYKENDFNYDNMTSNRLSNKAEEMNKKEISPRFESYATAYRESDYCVASNRNSADNRDIGFESYRSSMNPTFRDMSSKPETRDTGFETFRSSVNASSQRDKLHEYGLPENSRSKFDSARSSNLDDIEDVYEKTFGKFKSMNTHSYLGSKPLTAELPTVKKDDTILGDGFKEIRYANGNVKRVSPDGNIIKLTYYNGDLKETNLNTGFIKYYYAKTKTSHTTFPDGYELLEFPNGQTEKRYKNGRIEVNFPNGYKKVEDAQGNETWYYSDGTKVVTKVNGDKIIELPNGQKEIHNQDHKRREYPDGTVKLLYPDGSTETRYSSGRVRIKDKTGQLIMDTQK